MKVIDAYILAATKRKTRRIRTGLVVVVSSLLFAILFFGAFVAKGVLDASSQVKDVGFNGRNLVSISATGGGASEDFKAETDKIHADMDAELRAKGVKVTDDTRQDASYTSEFARRMQAQSVQQASAAQQQLTDSVTHLGKPTAMYHFAPMSLAGDAVYQPSPQADPYADKLKQEQEAGGVAPHTDPSDQLGGFQFYNVEQAMLRTQLQPGQNGAWKPGEPYPLFISYAYLEKLSGRSFAKVDAAAHNKGYRDLMKQYAGKTLNYCYRNAVAQQQLQQVEIYNYKAAHDTDKATNPVDVPLCGGFDQALLKKIGVISDPDPNAPKPLFAAPASPAPHTQEIAFKIVGYVPSQSQYSGGDIVSRVVTDVNQLPGNSEMGIIPSEVVAQDSVLQPEPDSFYGQFYALFADFATRAEEKAFIAQGCTGNECGSPKNTKPYVMPFGSISFALEKIFHRASQFLFIGVVGIMAVAALLIMFTISKVIADSTKEIAVFRSLGARRRDIAEIYYLYGLMLAIAGLVLALVLAIIGAEVVTSMYATSISNSFVQTVGAYNTGMHVHLLGVRWLWIGGAIAALLISAFIGITIPIIASLRRKLITILREE